MLNKEQQEAVLHFETPLLVLAGAGSGKTRVITAKIAKILELQLAMPSQILAVTFTNKAANEMLERVQSLIKIEGRYLNIGTFHRISLKILRRYGETLGYTKNFIILDTSDQQKVISDILKRLKITDVLKPQAVAGFISKIKEKYLKPQELNTALHNFPPIFTTIEIVRIYEEYQKELKRLDAMDFDDLIFNCITLLQQHEEIRTSYQNLFKYILIDEYQDINGLQQKWVKLILGNNKNITCVGDDDQSIYGWRGSDISFILCFNKENSDAKVVKLEQNYRSTKDILNVASKLIQHNTGRHGKVLWTDNLETTPVKIDIYQDTKTEAKAITGKIQELMHRYKYSECAILVRAIRQTRSIEEAMVFAGIPYRIIGGLRFYERREIKDILAYIKILVSSEDDIATQRVLSTPKRGLGEGTATKLSENARSKNTTILHEVLALAPTTNGSSSSKAATSPAAYEVHQDDLFFSGNAPRTTTPPASLQQENKELERMKAELGLRGGSLAKLMALAEQIRKWRKNLQANTVVNVIKGILQEINYEEYLKKDDEESFDQRVENINELLNTLESYETAEEFLDYVSLATSVDDIDSNADAVNIMTIHASKGLEYSVVFLPSWNQGSFPSDRTIEELGLTGIEEERRLAYVAITRARERLYISATKLSALKQGFSLAAEKSMFLDEILETADESIDFTEHSSFQSGYSSSFQGYQQKRYTQPKAAQNFTSPTPMEASFFIGNLVSHAKFGIGTVTKIAGTLVTVKFSDGTEKTIREDFLKRKHI